MNLNHYLRKKLYVNRRKEILFKFIYQFYFIFSTMKQGVLQQRRGGLLTNYEQLVEEQNCLTNQINLLQAQLNTFPPGKICIAKCKKYSRHYQSDGHVSTYIPAKNKQLIHDLTAKKYLNLKLEYLLYIPIALHHVHGVLKPLSRKMRTTFTETVPLHDYC